MKMEIGFLFSAYCLIMLYICSKVHENTFDGFKSIERIRFSDLKKSQKSVDEVSVAFQCTSLYICTKILRIYL